MMPDSDILKTLTSDVKVLVWASKEPLSESTPLFSTVDYLLDGLLRQHVRNHPTPQSEVTFVHTLYGESFWLAFTDGSSDADVYTKTLTSVVPEKMRDKMVVLNSEELTSKLRTKLDKAFKFVEYL
ncbi:MAG: hypothetical protein K2P81_17235 [Bacteriovoracaceae bacterium]|nr:hypothetical protein [Bacteriovoracaceae bacterium]